MAELVLEPEARRNLALLGAALAGFFGFAFFALGIVTQNVLLMTVLFAIVGFVVVLPFPKLAVVLVVLFAQVQYLFTTYHGSIFRTPVFHTIQFQWLDEVILLALLVNLTLTKLLRKEPIHKAPALALLTGLFLVGVISARFNGIGLRTGLLGERYVFEMVILYLAIINMDLEESFLRGLVYLLLAIGVLQAIVGLFEFAAKYRLYLAGNHDIVQGTWGGGSANNIGIFFLCLSAIALAKLRRRWHGPTALLFGIYVILLVLSSSRSGIVLSPLVFLFILREKMKKPQYWIGATMVFVFLAAILAFYYRNTDAEISEDLGGDEFLFQAGGRTRVIPVMSQVLRDNSRFPPFGAGPGTYVPAMGDYFGSTMYIELESMLRTRQVILPFISASYAVVWMEYGIVGLILFVLVFVRLFLYARRQEKIVESPFWKDYLRALQAIIAVYALVGGIFPLWTHFQTSIYLWLFPAIGVKYVILRRQKAMRGAPAAASQNETASRSLPSPAPSH